MTLSCGGLPPEMASALRAWLLSSPGTATNPLAQLHPILSSIPHLPDDTLAQHADWWVWLLSHITLQAHTQKPHWLNTSHALYQTLEPRLAKILKPQTGIKSLVGQINPTPGDLAGNARQMMALWHLANNLGLDWVAFPELALLGYPIGDVITRHPSLITQQLDWLASMADVIQTGHTRALIGIAEPVQDGSNLFYNTVAILGPHGGEGVVRKALLPAYQEFYDTRIFQAGEALGTQPWQASGPLCAVISPAPSQETHGVTEADPRWHCAGKAYALTICEDIWADPTFFEATVHPQSRQTPPNDPVSRWRRWQTEHPQRPINAYLNLSASPSRARKLGLRQALLSHLAQSTQRPWVYVNQVGSVDELSFDGTSSVWHADGTCVACAPGFAAGGLLIQTDTLCGNTPPKPLLINRWAPLQKTPVTIAEQGASIAATPSTAPFNPFDTHDFPRLYAALVQGIRDYFAKCGFKKAVLGLSGGLDSAVVAVLAADALGPSNVLAVRMPTTLTAPQSEDDAKAIADNLGIPLLDVTLSPIVNAFSEGFTQAHWARPNSAWPNTLPLQDNAPTSFAADNVQAMSRATLLRLLGNHYNALPLATSDKSELYLGYATVNGDMSGALAPLGDVPKTRVRQLAYWLNTHRPDQPPALPEVVMTKPSGAELAVDPTTGQALTAEAALMPYMFADELIWRLEKHHQSPHQMIDSPFFYEQWAIEQGQAPVSPEQKQTWVALFFKRMTQNVFKWWLMPPMLLVDGNGSITKTEYHHPIVASQTVWQGHTPDERAALLTLP